MPIEPPVHIPKQDREWSKFFRDSLVTPDLLREYTVAQLATVPTTIRIAIVTNEAGGEVLAFRDSADAWRRCTDRAVCS